MQLHEILKRPLITEKNAALQPTGKYVFEVGGRANKMQIKNAVEEAFKGNSYRGQYHHHPQPGKESR